MVRIGPVRSCQRLLVLLEQFRSDFPGPNIVQLQAPDMPPEEARRSIPLIVRHLELSLGVG